MAPESLKVFLEARDFLLNNRTDYAAAYRGFQWPELTHFNWALDYFDTMAAGNARPALWVLDEDGSETKLSFSQMSDRSNRVANFLRSPGVKRGDRILEQWFVMNAMVSSTTDSASSRRWEKSWARPLILSISTLRQG